MGPVPCREGVSARSECGVDLSVVASMITATKAWIPQMDCSNHWRRLRTFERTHSESSRRIGRITGWGHVILLAPAHARPIAGSGYTKSAAKEFLHQHVKAPASEMVAHFNVPEKVRYEWRCCMTCLRGSRSG